MFANGRVFLVGAGPGDPGLLTLRAKEVIETADVIVYDRLVSNDVLSFAPIKARQIYVGKLSGRHSVPQSKINLMLIRLAGDYRRVVRLKGGDPLIFGRGGEEAAVLAEHGVPFEVVPGITAAQGAAADLSIPLTLRGVSTSLRYVTGHLRDDADMENQDWRGFADDSTTLAVYMGTSTIGYFAAKLIAHGRRSDTSVVAVNNATSDRQRTVTAKLDGICEATKQAEFKGPVLFIIGDVVRQMRQQSGSEREPYEGFSGDAQRLMGARRHENTAVYPAVSVAHDHDRRRDT